MSADMCVPAALAGVVAATLAANASAQAIAPFYEANYSLEDLGSVPGVPSNYGGLTFDVDNPNILLIGGQANTQSAAIYAITVERGCGDRIVGFIGTAKLFAAAPGASGGIDGGLDYGPQDVLFYTSYSDNHIGQIMPSSDGPDKLIALTPLGVSSSTGTLRFVPEGFAGEGRLKIASFNSSRWYDAEIEPDGDGTFDIVNVEERAQLTGGPEGIVYVSAGNPDFSSDSVLLCEYSAGQVASYEIDDAGDPIVDTRQTFVSGLSGAEGATFDPVTGDFLFSTFGGGNRVIIVRGFDGPERSDINQDGVVNGTDLALLLADWNTCQEDEPCPADINGDCEINGTDLAILLSNWG